MEVRTVVTNGPARTWEPLGYCPECRAELVERINSGTGEAFLGCRRWPDCRYTRPLPESIKLRRAGHPVFPGFE